MKTKQVHLFTAVLFLLTIFASPRAVAAELIDFQKQIKPILELECLSCHGPERPRGGLNLDSLAGAIAGGDYGASLVPGKPEESPLYTSTILPADHDDLMPPANRGGPLPEEITELLRLWIEQGAQWPEDIVLKQVQKVDFITHVKPVLEFNCLSCHATGNDKGGLRLDTREGAFAGGESGPAIVPGKSSASLLYTSTILPEDHDDLMPPTNRGGPLPKDVTDLLRFWIDQGAPWPDDLNLVARKIEAEQENELLVTTEIHAKIMANLEVTEESAMQPYSLRIPGSRATYEMVPIPGGEFVMGSPESEPGRKSDEGPQIRVAVEPFWMGKFEVTWNEYELFMYPNEEKKIRDFLGFQAEENAVADGVTRPTTPYVEMSFGMGKDGYPAISMTQHAANKYCQWLSAKTGHFYRLPTEAEWEYACRAGTTTAYFFGDDPSLLDEYAWFEENSNWKYQKVGKKKPNHWGLHDMHGNVAEWTLDQYNPNYYQELIGGVVSSPWNKATEPYPHSVRGGSWDDTPELLRSAARRPSDRVWKQQDPQLPKSVWYHTDAQFLGFRIARPLKVPPPEELSKYWTSGVEKD
jgi:formylglycine-generating enzyme required for sulfatase activity